MSVNRAITWTTYCLYAYAAHVYRLNISEVARFWNCYSYFIYYRSLSLAVVSKSVNRTPPPPPQKKDWISFLTEITWSNKNIPEEGLPSSNGRLLLLRILIAQLASNSHSKRTIFTEKPGKYHPQRKRKATQLSKNSKD